MQVLRLTHDDVTELEEIRLSQKWDWPATFSCNQGRQVWPCVTFGLRPPDDRYQVGGLPKLDEIVDGVLRESPEGGGFHVDREGVALARDGQKIIEFEYGSA